MHAEGDTVIVLWDGRGPATDDQPYENSYAWFMSMHDGKVIDGTAVYDSISFNDRWTESNPSRSQSQPARTVSREDSGI